MAASQARFGAGRRVSSMMQSAAMATRIGTRLTGASAGRVSTVSVLKTA